MNTKLIPIVIIIAIIFSSCSNDVPSGFTTAENGTLYEVHYRGDDSNKTQENDVVTVKMSYRLGDSVIFNSTILGAPMVFPVVKPMFKGDVYDALKLMGTGDSLTIAVIADSFYLKTANLSELPDFVVPGSYLYYDIKLLKHVSNDVYQRKLVEKLKESEKQEKVILNEFLIKNEINIQPTASGLYFIPIKDGTGNTPDSGNVCQVSLSVKQLDGVELFTNFDGEPLDVIYGSQFDTKGFMEGLGMLKVGEIAQFIVPSWIGFGASGMQMVAPYTTLVYDVKLESVKVNN
jgi:FKBP-type peptidyl-prolyl cis-trans isomerase